MINTKYARSTAKMVLSRTRQKLHPVLRVMERGDARYCPCCQTHLRRFKPYGEIVVRPEAMCGVCGSVERDRLMYLFLTQKTDLLDGSRKKLLHVAPELAMQKLFQSAKNIDYLSADLADVSAMVKMDITDIAYPDNTFDVVYCSHVLEHVPDDRRAMREFLRVLKRGRWALLHVPITADATFEDSSITDPKERERVFGQFDHVRCYGPDYGDRLAEAGFIVEKNQYVEEIGPADTKRCGLDPNEAVYLCRKP
ncbi:MAG TPA: methyltransferase domain-containing protein [Lacipirellulaceae bacterium]|jgi:SAM-dependent methyltransferase|nr:methyltransferase domain-containing protein [Lacipirellulaceae bacterium]